MPVGSSGKGQLTRGYMVWEKPVQGYTDVAKMDFLYNPSTVSADYYIADASVGSALMFPTGFNSTNLRIPLSQTVEWSLLFDRTYELWGSYRDDGTPLYQLNEHGNTPEVVGVLADINQMEQFTGMKIGYTSVTAPGTGVASSNTLFNKQGIIQLVPSWVFFGDQNNLQYYGYISEWDVTITHWTQFMVPMRCVINVSWTMLPSPSSSTTTGSQANVNWSTYVGSHGHQGGN